MTTVDHTDATMEDAVSAAVMNELEQPRTENRVLCSHVLGVDSDKDSGLRSCSNCIQIAKI